MLTCQQGQEDKMDDVMDCLLREKVGTASNTIPVLGVCFCQSLLTCFLAVSSVVVFPGDR